MTLSFLNKHCSTSFKRDKEDTRFVHSEAISMPILFDTGAANNLIPSKLLMELEKFGVHIEKVPCSDNLRFIDGNTRVLPEYYIIDMFLSRDLLIRSGKFYCIDTDYLLLGRDFIRHFVLDYGTEYLTLAKQSELDCPNSIPLFIDPSGQVYIELSVNGRINKYKFDTGCFDDLALPLSDMAYSISPITEKATTLTAGGITKPVLDHIESRGEVKIGNIIKHGPITYTDEYLKRYFFNPTNIFREFSIDYKNGVMKTR